MLVVPTNPHLRETPMSRNPSLSEAVRSLAVSRVTVQPGTPSYGVAFERAVADVLNELGARALEAELRAGDRGDQVVDGDGTTWTCAVRSTATYVSRFGEVRLERGLYRAVRNGPTRCFVEERYGILCGRWTPEAARLAALLMTDLTSRGAERFFKEQGGMCPSRSALDRLPTSLGETAEANRERLDAELRRAYQIPATAAVVAVMLDGVMVKLQVNNRQALVQAAKEAGRKVGGPVGSSEASVGAVTFYDADGERLLTRRFSRMPEEDKSTLKDMLRRELAHVRRLRPDLIVVAISDGAPNNWSFLESLDPDHQIVDAYHTLEHIKRRLDRALGVGTLLNQETYDRMKDLLLGVVGGHFIVFEALEALEKRRGTYRERKRKGRGAQPIFYERHAHRMQYVELRAWQIPIGSGVIEGTARYMVVDRLRRTGMRWKHAGGQAILTFRQWAVNDQFNEAWDLLRELQAANTQAAWAPALAG